MVRSFKGFWSRLCCKNKSLENEETKITISVESFKYQMEKAYKQGAVDGVTAIKDFQNLGEKGSSLDFEKMVNNMFETKF